MATDALNPASVRKVDGHASEDKREEAKQLSCYHSTAVNAAISA